MSSTPEKLDEILDLLRGPALFGEIDKGPGPLMPSGSAYSILNLPTTGFSGWAIETTNFDDLSFSYRFRSPDGYRSREFFAQLFKVRGT